MPYKTSKSTCTNFNETFKQDAYKFKKFVIVKCAILHTTKISMMYKALQ
jgi:hypothetical protein